MGQRQTRESPATAQAHVGLAVTECTTAKIDVDAVKGLPLALVDRDCPAEAQRQLLVGADLLPGDLLRPPIILVGQVLPRGTGYRMCRAILELHRGAFITERGDEPPGTIDPAPVRIVPEEHHPGTDFQGQCRLGGKSGGIEFPADLG